MLDLKALTSNQKFLLNLTVPALYLFPLLVVFFLPKNFGFGNHDLVPIGLAVGIFGLTVWIAGMACLGKSLAVLPGASSIVARGVYRLVRHPIYVGIVLTQLGLFFACGSVFGMVYLFVLVIPLNVIRARMEEQALLSKFSDRYRIYRDSTWF